MHEISVRPAAFADLERVTALTRARRSTLARHAPVYFNPSEGADEAHAWFLEFIIRSEEHATHSLTAGGEVVGFFVLVAQADHIWVDDLCLDGYDLWPGALSAISTIVGDPWVTCVSPKEHHRQMALAAQGLVRRSSYWARSVRPATRPDAQPAAPPFTLSAAEVPAHTFSDKPFSAGTPGALVVVDRSGYAIGSAPVTPPIFDPGGPTTVVDQVVGGDRRRLLEQVLAAASSRGDAQVVVVVSDIDDELAAIAETLGFRRVIDLIGSATRSSGGN